ncbi:uncharacterized protein LOC122544264 [Chiloscyllium plagiosum]|uniref:uncharacterized protein LOC122544264 n=1 Tax=Chiloscyllium plagiosum TaxID=36176 RepID=UPI001CB7E08F|nr:uncharacterized protein LOC122544264 [Chiloscyllium plagiosum]
MLPPLNRARGWKCAAVLLAVPAVLYLRPWPWLWRWVSERFRRVRLSLAGPSASVSFKVKCYGQGKVHEDILKNLKISKCEGGAGSPCILFVYKVSRTNEDLRNALEWITNLENETTQKEDIFVAFLLEKISGESKDLGEEMITDLDVFHENTKVFRVLWKETCGSQPGFRCPEAIRTIREKINPGIEKSRSETMARLWRYVWKFGLCLGLILFFEILVQKVYCKLSVGSGMFPLPLHFTALRSDGFAHQLLDFDHLHM